MHLTIDQHPSIRTIFRLLDASLPLVIVKSANSTGFGYGCLAAETNIGVVHVCHAADGIPLQISARGGYLPSSPKVSRPPLH